MVDTKKALFTVEVPSTDFITEGYLDCSDGFPSVRYSYEMNGEVSHAGIKFINVSALRMRGERYCTAWHIEGAYDSLVEVENSSWISELLNDMPEQYRSAWQPHHYMIYLDSVGCFEFLAESWQRLGTPSTKGAATSEP
jgi:hypothetical protein